MTKWSETAWNKANKIYQAILKQPFLLEMADGTLAVDKFDRYLAQDEVYIGNYGRSMFDLADIIPNEEQRQTFIDFAREGMESEQQMHQLLIDRFGIDTAVEASVVTATYNKHTQAAVATGSKEIALAAILPCAWIYNEVGHEVLKIAKMEGNPYREWMAEYANEAFTIGAQMMVDMADEWAEAATEEVREKMTQVFVEATLMEYAFWEYGYLGDAQNYDYIKHPEEWI